MPLSTADTPDGKRPGAPKAAPKVAEAPAASPPPVSQPEVPLRPAAESADPAVHRLLFERQAAAEVGDDAGLSRVADALRTLGYR